MPSIIPETPSDTLAAYTKDEILTTIGEWRDPILTSIQPKWEERLRNGHITQSVYHEIMDDYLVLYNNLLNLNQTITENLVDV
jgi:hypothetical protein